MFPRIHGALELRSRPFVREALTGLDPNGKGTVGIQSTGKNSSSRSRWAEVPVSTARKIIGRYLLRPRARRAAGEFCRQGARDPGRSLRRAYAARYLVPRKKTSSPRARRALHAAARVRHRRSAGRLFDLHVPKAPKRGPRKKGLRKAGGTRAMDMNGRAAVPARHLDSNKADLPRGTSSLRAISPHPGHEGGFSGEEDPTIDGRAQGAGRV